MSSFLSSAPNPSPLRRASVFFALAAFLAMAWLGPLDSLSRDYVDAGLKRAMATFAVARGANAVISVVQSTTLSGVVISASPGQALDPLNQVVEDFSNLMLAACVSLGAQRLLISVGALRGISIALTVALLAWAALALRGRGSPPWLVRIALLLLFVRFAVPLAALGSEATFRLAMQDQYDRAQSQVALSIEPPPAAKAPASGADASLLDRLSAWLASKGADIKAGVITLKSRMEDAIGHIVTLMAVFVVQTAILPLLFLWLSYRLFGATLRWPAPWAPR